MDFEFVRRLFSLVDFDYLLLNKIAVLSVSLLFFVAVRAINALSRKKLPDSKVTATIKLALLGFVLLLFELTAGRGSRYAPYISGLEGLVVVLCLANLAAYLLVDVYAQARMTRPLPSILRDLLLLLVYLFFALTSLRVVFRIDISSILTTTTVLTAAVALAMQTTIANVISGFHVQGDRNLKPGSWIALKEKDILGEVVNVGFRYTTLRTLDNHDVLVPNHLLTQNVVTRIGNPEDGMKGGINLKVGLGYEIPPDHAIRIMLPILRQEEDIAAEPAPSVRISALHENGVEYNLKYYLNDYSKGIKVRGNVLSRVWYAVTREGYAFPVPKREVVVGSHMPAFGTDGSGILSILKRSEILGFLPEEGLRRMSDRVKSKVYGAREPIVLQSDPGDSLFIVDRGTLRVLVDGTVVGRLTEGDFFGEMSLLTGEKRRATVVAEEEVHVIEIAKADIEPFLRGNPDLQDRLSAVVARREEINRSHAAEPTAEVAVPREAILVRLKSFFNL